MALSILSITEQAADRIQALVSKSDSAMGIRVSLKKGGCAEFKYDIQLADAKSEGDEEIQEHGATVLVDPGAMLHIFGSTLDFTRDKLESKFFFTNPNQTGACGCGESFTTG